MRHTRRCVTCHGHGLRPAQVWVWGSSAYGYPGIEAPHEFDNNLILCSFLSPFFVVVVVVVVVVCCCLLLLLFSMMMMALFVCLFACLFACMFMNRYIRVSGYSNHLRM